MIDINIRWTQEVFLTLVNEHLHGFLRIKSPSPALLDCARIITSTSTNETENQQAESCFIYTFESNTKNANPARFFKFDQIPKLTRESNFKMSKENLIKLYESRSKFYERVVRQGAVGADSTKDTLETRPIYVYIKELNRIHSSDIFNQWH